MWDPSRFTCQGRKWRSEVCAQEQEEVERKQDTSEDSRPYAVAQLNEGGLMKEAHSQAGRIKRPNGRVRRTGATIGDTTGGSWSWQGETGSIAPSTLTHLALTQSSGYLSPG